MSDSEPTVDAKAEEAAAADAGGLNNRKRRSYTAALKLEVVKIAKQSSLQAASKLFNIDRHMIRSWRADEEKLKLFNAPAFAGKKRMPGGGRPVKFKQLDDRIAAWVRERLDRQLPVSRRIIQIQAERMSCAEADGGDEKFFKASSGWLEKFLARHNFNLGNNSSSAVNSKSLDAVENMSADLSVSGQDNSELFEPVPMNSKANGQQFDNDSIADVFEQLQQHLDQPPNLSFFGTSTSTSNEDSCEATEQQQQVAGISLNSQLPALDHILVWALISPQRHQPPTSNNNNDSSNNSSGRRTYFMCNWQDLLDDGNAEEANNGTDTAEEKEPSSLAYVVHKKLSAIPDPSEEGCFSTSLPVNAVLNAFSTLGYRTIGMANKCTDEILWTLAKPLLKTSNIFTI